MYFPASKMSCSAQLLGGTLKYGDGQTTNRVDLNSSFTIHLVRGKDVSYSMKLALAWVEDTMWEVIEPVDGPSIYKEFLEEHGEGLHHVLVDHQGLDFDAALAEFSKRGCPPLMEGKFGEVRYAYVDSEGPLRTVLEIVHRPPGFKRPEPDYWYPAPPPAKS